MDYLYDTNRGAYWNNFPTDEAIHQGKKWIILSGWCVDSSQLIHDEKFWPELYKILLTYVP